MSTPLMRLIGNPVVIKGWADVGAEVGYSCPTFTFAGLS